MKQSIYFVEMVAEMKIAQFFFLTWIFLKTFLSLDKLITHGPALKIDVQFYVKEC